MSIEEIKSKYVQETYLQMLGFEADQQLAAYAVISKCLIWNKALDSFKQDEFKEISQEIISKDEKFKVVSHELYYEYVLNTLPYRSYANILEVINNKDLPDIYRQKLQLVIIYCQLNDFEKTDNTPLSLILVEDKETTENILISLQSLEYLNSQNTVGFNLDQFRVNSFTANHYTTLKNLFSKHKMTVDNAQIDYSHLEQALFNNLDQLQQNNHLTGEINKLINNFVNVEIKTISKEDLRKIVENDIVQNYLKEIECQTLGLNHFEKINFPQYLQDVICGKFSAANFVAEQINQLMTNIIKNNNIILSEEQVKKIKEICYQVALAPGQDITLSLEFKKRLMDDFQDGNLLITEAEADGKDEEHQIDMAGDFIQIKKYLEINDIVSGNNINIEKLPDLLVKKAEQLSFSANCVELLENLFSKLNLLPALKGKISRNEISYLLGVIFMDMSSIHVLGYHSDSENIAFARFRLLGAYYLAKSICQNDTWTSEQQQTIGREIKFAILSGECSGLIANRLYGLTSISALKNIYNKIKFILEVRAT